MSLSTTRENPDEWMMPAYIPAPFIPVRGKGSRLWDQQGKGYIDFAGDIAVNALGHAHSALRETLNDQASEFWHTGNGYTNEPVLCLARRLIDTTFVGRIFFYNSGTEANEAVLELACKYAHNRFGNQKNGTIAFKSAFHGHTLLTVSTGGQPAYSQDFAPLPPGIHHAIYNDLDSASQLIDDITYAVIVEPAQGEGGMVPTTEALLQGLRELCDRHSVLLIFDKVQTGVGHTGELYTYMYYGVAPDLLTTAKALGGGFPVSALLATKCCANVMTVDTHDTTYGGSPLVTTVTGKLLEIVNTLKVLNGVKQRHDWFVGRINTISERFGLFDEIHRLGLLIGCVLNAEFAGKVELISQEAAVAGVMVPIAGANVVRFASALNISEEEVATGLGRFMLACERIKAGGSS